MLQGHSQERLNCPRSNSGECELIPVLTRFLGDWTILWFRHHRWLGETFELLRQVKPSRVGWFLRGQQCWEFTWGIWCLGRSAEGYGVCMHVYVGGGDFSPLLSCSGLWSCLCNFPWSLFCEI